jgi:two-component system sensor histidine kinase DesK
MTRPREWWLGLSRARRWELFGYAMASSWLILLFFPSLSLLQRPLGAFAKAVILGGVAAFAAVYTLSWFRPRAGMLVAAASVGIMSILATALNLATGDLLFVGLFIYVIVVAGARLRWTVATAVIAGLCTLVGVLGYFADVPLTGVSSLVITFLLIGVAAMAVALLVQTIFELQAARERITRLAVSEERLRFARDLHDLLGHSLSVVVLKSELAGRLLNRDPERAGTEIADINRVSRESLREVREAVAGYRQPTLNSEIEGARSALRAAGIQLKAEDGVGSVPPKVEMVLAWAVREGATNVVRHSEANRCTIRTMREDHTAILEVVDDGRGCAEVPLGHGLTGLTERVAERGGRLYTHALPEQGFRLHVEVPIVDDAADGAAAP